MRNIVWIHADDISHSAVTTDRDSPPRGSGILDVFQFHREFRHSFSFSIRYSGVLIDRHICRFARANSGTTAEEITTLANEHYMGALARHIDGASDHGLHWLVVDLDSHNVLKEPSGSWHIGYP
jgi:hypothetical protein